MHPYAVAATAARILRQLRHDVRTLVILTVIPLVILTLLHYLFDERQPLVSQIEARMLVVFSMMIMFPLTFLSNAFVPVETLPSWLAAFVRVNPVSLVVTAVRDLANTGTLTGAVGWALVGCAAAIVIFAPLAVRQYARKM